MSLSHKHIKYFIVCPSFGAFLLVSCCILSVCSKTHKPHLHADCKLRSLQFEVRILCLTYIAPIGGSKYIYYLTPNTPLIHTSFTYSKLNMHEICSLKLSWWIMDLCQLIISKHQNMGSKIGWNYDHVVKEWLPMVGSFCSHLVQGRTGQTCWKILILYLQSYIVKCQFCNYELKELTVIIYTVPARP